MAKNAVTKVLLDNLCSVRLLLDKLRIVNKGQPTPPLPNVTAHHKTKNGVQDIFASLSMNRLTG